MKIFLAFLALSIYAASAAVEEAYCHVHGTDQDPSIRGNIVFKTNGNDVDMEVDVWGITENVNTSHGIHIHEFGDLSSPSDGSSVGGHFNPNGESHGCPPNTSRHVGDTGNWEVSENGTISQMKTLDLLTLTGMNSIVGRAVVIHADTDNCVDVPSSGSRLAWCVIGVRNTQATNNAWNAYNDTKVAVCDLQATDGNNVSGRVWFQKSDNQTMVVAKVWGISGLHGFHIHEYGDLSSPTGVNTGGHYNPNGDTHGIPDYTPRHVGDMGNLYHYDDNIAYYNYTHDMIHLVGEHNVIGRAVIVHAQQDDCGQPTGNAGSRLAQCVIGITSDDVELPADLPTIPSTQDSSACEATSEGTAISDGTATSEHTGSSDNNTTEESDSGAFSLAAGMGVFAAVLLAL